MFTPRLHPRDRRGRFVPVGFGIGKGKKERLNKFVIGSGMTGGARRQAARLQAQFRLSDRAGEFRIPVQRDVSHWAAGSRRRRRVDVYTRVAFRRVPALRGTKRVPVVARVRRRRAAPRRK